MSSGIPEGVPSKSMKGSSRSAFPGMRISCSAQPNILRFAVREMANARCELRARISGESSVSRSGNDEVLGGIVRGKKWIAPG